jgi:hypothetical protein
VGDRSPYADLVNTNLSLAAKNFAERETLFVIDMSVSVLPYFRDFIPLHVL